LSVPLGLPSGLGGTHTLCRQLFLALFDERLVPLRDFIQAFSCTDNTDSDPHFVKLRVI